MAQEKINLSKINYNPSQFGIVINTAFSQATPPPVPQTVLPIINVSDFFKSYENLFYQIPEMGETDSHEFLIKKSTEYIGEQQSSDQTQALIAEITALRLESVESFKKEAELIALQTENQALKQQLAALTPSGSKK